MKAITIVEVNKAKDFPPVQNVIKALLNDGCKVFLISRSIEELSTEIINHHNFLGFEIPWIEEKNFYDKVKHRIILNKYVRKKTAECMRQSDYLWTTSINSIRELRQDVFKYKHIFQLMELTRYGYLTALHIKYSLEKIAQHAHVVVAPEINRAYIEKVWWQLDKLPVVLPNKPYDINPGMLTSDMNNAIHKIKNEKRRIVLYLGGIFSDRNLEIVAKAIQCHDDYVLYIVGNVFSKEGKEQLSQLLHNYPVVYLGGFNSPKHLHFVKYAYMGVLPYKPIKSSSSSELNALYCAPNKIYEYAGFSIPMIGSNVLGLKLPFEKWNVGCCYDDNSLESVSAAIRNVEKNHSIMEKNCHKFFNDIDITQIIHTIIKD